MICAKAIFAAAKFNVIVVQNKKKVYKLVSLGITFMGFDHY